MTTATIDHAIEVIAERFGDGRLQLGIDYANSKGYSNVYEFLNLAVSRIRFDDEQLAAGEFFKIEPSVLDAYVEGNPEINELIKFRQAKQIMFEARKKIEAIGLQTLQRELNLRQEGGAEWRVLNLSVADTLQRANDVLDLRFRLF